MTRRMNDPEKHPMVLKMKYTLVATAAASRVYPSLSMRSFGAVVFVPTSIPTWHMMPRKQRRMNGRPRSEKHSLKPEAASLFSSSILVDDNAKIAITAITIYIGKSTRQPSPNEGMACTAPQMAIYGARKEAIALTNWPNVSVEARRSGFTILLISGLSDVCMSALPIPRREKEMSMSG